MNQETTDKTIIYGMLQARKVDNNKIYKALFENLRPLDMYQVRVT